jgi:hypothetical protein
LTEPIVVVRLPRDVANEVAEFLEHACNLHSLSLPPNGELGVAVSRRRQALAAIREALPPPEQSTGNVVSLDERRCRR